MSDVPEATEALLDVADRFQASPFEFMIVGGFAVMAHGRPRTTADIDVAIHLRFNEREEVEPLLEDLGDGEIEERVAPEWGKRLVTTHPSGLRIEVFFTAGHQLYEREFERSVTVNLNGREVPFISPEDLILRKLVNMRKRRGVDWEDALSVGHVQGDDLDYTYLRDHCAVHRVCGLVDQIEDAARA